MKRFLFILAIICSFSSTGQDDSAALAERIAYGMDNYVFRIGYWDTLANDCKEAGFTKMQATAVNNLGVLKNYNGDIPGAIEAMDQSLRLLESLNDSTGQAQAHNALGMLLGSYGDTATGIRHLEESIYLYRLLGSPEGIGAPLNNISSHYKQKGEFEKASEVLHEAKNVYLRENDFQSLVMVYGNIGMVFYDLEVYDSARIWLLKAYNLADSMDYEALKEHSLSYLGSLDYEEGNYQGAKARLEKALAISQNNKNADGTRRAAQKLRRVYYSLGEFKKAYDTYDLYVTMRDCLYSDESRKAAIQQELEYHYQKQALTDSLKAQEKIKLEREKTLAEKKENKYLQNLTFLIIVSLVVVLLLAFVIYRRLQVTRKQKAVIEEQKKEVEIQRAIAQEQQEIAEERNKEILDSIEYAKRIQNAILPPDEEFNKVLPNSFVFYLPKDIVAGDFYWLESVNETVLFAAADCTGHGVPGAMVSVLCNNSLNRSVREYNLTTPGKILDKTRELIIEEFKKSVEKVKDGMDIALCSLSGNKLEYAGAHNPLWLIRRGADVVEEIKANKQPIGEFDDPQPYTTHELTLNPGDSIYVFSDGFADQFGGAKGKKFKASNMKEMLLSIQEMSMDEQKQALHNSFENWRGDLEQLDDVCVIGVRV